MATPQANKIRRFQQAASLHPHVGFMQEQNQIDRSRRQRILTPTHRRVDDVKKSVAQLSNEIEYIYDHMDDDERLGYQASPKLSAETREPLDVTILRHSIAAAIGRTVPSVQENDTSGSEVLQFSDHEHHESASDLKAIIEEEDEPHHISDSQKHDAKERPRPTSKDRSMRMEDVLSSSRNRSTLSRTGELRNSRCPRSPEHDRAMMASEKARRIIESPYFTKSIGDIPNPREVQSFGTTRATRSGRKIDIKQIPGVVDHIERLKKTPPTPPPEFEAVILPNPPGVTPSFTKISGILTSEISDILVHVNEEVPV
jgi:hypothetical protein